LGLAELDRFAAVLYPGRAGSAEAESIRRFDDRLCEALLALTPAHRVLFLRVEQGDRVLPAGAAGVALPSSGARTRPLSDVPNARLALESDRVVVDSRLPWTPEELAIRGDGQAVMYTPVSAGHHWFGIFVCDAGADRTDPHGEPWMLGKMAALAVSSRQAASDDERAREAQRRRRLERELERKVTQRMVSVAVTLAAEHTPEPSTLRLCRDELDTAHATLRRIFTRRLRTPSRPLAVR